MSDDRGRLNRKARLSVMGIAALALVAGIGAAFLTPGIGPWIEWAMGGFLIVCGLVLLSPFATVRQSDEAHRATRRRVSVMGAAYVLFGVALLVTSVSTRLALMSVMLVLMAGAATGWPNRVFAPRS